MLLERRHHSRWEGEEAIVINQITVSITVVPQCHRDLTAKKGSFDPRGEPGIHLGIDPNAPHGTFKVLLLSNLFHCFSK